jgi:hypothetical protein
MNPARQTVRKVANVLRGATSVVRGRVTADELLRSQRYGVEFPEDRFAPRSSREVEYVATRDAGYQSSSRSSLAIGVLIHDRIDLARLLRARLEAVANLFREARIYIVGEDSTDGTEEDRRSTKRTARGDRSGCFDRFRRTARR